MNPIEAAIPAATLVLMRHRPAESPDLLAVTRAKNMAFAGGALAFPGGRVDAADHRFAEAFDDPLAAWKVAAIRETLEETAVPAGLRPAPDERDSCRIQDRLLTGAELGSVLREMGLDVDLPALTPFARWKPAFAQPRTFDTIFFLTAAPAGEWKPAPQAGECEAAEWASAAQLLDRIARGAAHAIFPTKRNLERLARFTTLDEARADAVAHPLDTITPWVEVRGGEKHVCIPEGRGYPVTSEPLATAFRA